MRSTFRKSFITQSQQDRVLFWAPIAVALILLLLFAQNKAVFASAWRSPLAVLADRSPGARDAGALYNIKPQRFKPVMAMAQPEERVLSAMRTRPLPMLETIPAEEPPLNLMLDQEPIVPGPELLALEAPIPEIPLGPVNRASPPCCGTVTNLAAVPEPTTWAMNIIGLFLAGGAMRYRNRKNRGLHSDSALPASA